MYTLEQIGGAWVRHVNGIPQVTKAGDLKGASGRYVTTDPDTIHRSLSDAGLKVTRIKRRSPDWTAFEVQDPQRSGILSRATGDMHQDLCKILMAHTGRHSLVIQAGTLRMACDNQFLEPWARIHHTDTRINDFLRDPADWVRDCLRNGANMLEKVDRLKEEPLLSDYTVLADLSDVLGPTLKGRFHTMLSRYTDRRGPNLWALAQACTFRTLENSPLRRAGMAVVLAEPNTEARLESWRDALKN